MNKFIDIKDKEPPFALMSLKPSIGYNAVNQSVINDGGFYYRGRFVHMPSSFVQSLKRNNCSFDISELVAKRIERGVFYSNCLSLKKRLDYTNKKFDLDISKKRMS